MRFEWDIDEETGEILNAQELDDLELARDTKIEGIGLYIKNLKAEQTAVKAEKDAMDDRAKRLGRKIESLENYLTYALDGNGFKTPKVVISFRPSESIEIESGARIPDEFMRVKPEVKEPDKKALKQAIKGGQIIDGVHLIKKVNPSVK